MPGNIVAAVPNGVTPFSFLESQKFGMAPFLFYDPFDVASGRQIGSNYDATGNNTQGRVTVVVRGNWAQSTDVCRSNVQGLQLVARPCASNWSTSACKRSSVGFIRP
jgi:hypothetical protein